MIIGPGKRKKEKERKKEKKGTQNENVFHVILLNPSTPSFAVNGSEGDRKEEKKRGGNLDE